MPYPEARSDRSRRRLTPVDRRLWWAAFLTAGILYVATANRTVQWQDSGWQQYRIVAGQIENSHGLALTHPLQYYIGRLAIRLPFFEPAFAVTLISSFAAAVAIANLAVVVDVLTRRRTAAVLAGGALMLSHTFWQHATYTESYAITIALLTCEWLCVAFYATTGRGRFLVLLALLNGLGIANHLLAVIATPVDAGLLVFAVRRKHLSGRAAVGAVVLWLLGTLPYSGLVLATILRTGDVTGTLGSALFGQYASDVLNIRVGGRMILLSAGYLAYNFPGLTVPLALFAIVARSTVPKVFFRTIAAQLVLYTLFVVRYTITDQYTFFLPVYALLAILAGIGLAGLLDAVRPTAGRVVVALSVITIAWTPLVYEATCSGLRSRGALSGMVGNKPYREGYRAFFIPWGVGQNYAVVLNRQAFDLAGNDGAILVVDDMVECGLRYAQVTERRTAQVILVDRAAEGEDSPELRALVASYLSAKRPVVLVPRDRDRPVEVVPGARWTRRGDLYLLDHL